MSDEDILKVVQEVPPVAEYEKSVTRSVMKIVTAIVISCLIVMIIAEWLIFKKADFGKPFLIALWGGLMDTIEWHRLREKKSLRITGFCQLLVAAFCLLCYVVSLVGVS